LNKQQLYNPALGFKILPDIFVANRFAKIKLLDNPTVAKRDGTRGKRSKQNDNDSMRGLIPSIHTLLCLLVIHSVKDSWHVQQRAKTRPLQTKQSLSLTSAARSSGLTRRGISQPLALHRHRTNRYKNRQSTHVIHGQKLAREITNFTLWMS